ncbi:hypothetical protein ACX0FC_19690, partial [Enterococcus faecium]
MASLPATAAAQTGVAAAPSPAPEATSGPDDDKNTIVVTGTRTAGRSKLDTASPVDVLSAATLRQQGTTETAQAL